MPWSTFGQVDIWIMPPATARGAAQNSVLSQFRADDRERLQQTAGFPTPDLTSARRCFGFAEDREVLAYGWVTRGAEGIGELERLLNVTESEAYIWNCQTLPDHRRRGLYTKLLRGLTAHLQSEGVSRIWIAAVSNNRPSLAGMRSAGFEPVATVIYVRLLGLTFTWLRPANAASSDRFREACRLVHRPGDIRIGSIALGFLR